MTFPDLLYDRHVLFWSDNCTALSAAVNGYTAYPDLAAMSNPVHLLLAGLRTRTYFLHVPGKANVADIPSRVPFIQGADGLFKLHPAGLCQAGDREAIHGIKAVHRPMLVPTLAQLQQPEVFLQSGYGWSEDVFEVTDCKIWVQCRRRRKSLSTYSILMCCQK